jgi:hypothetical protein
MKSGTNSTSILLNTQKETRSRWGDVASCGRWNAGCRRPHSTATPQDTKHAQFVQSQGLVHMETEEAHGHTHTTLIAGTAETVSSRIDDILMSKNCKAQVEVPGEAPLTTLLLVTLKHSRQACTFQPKLSPRQNQHPTGAPHQRRRHRGLSPTGSGALTEARFPRSTHTTSISRTSKHA